MNILWITNGLFPEAKELLTGESVEVKESGGWLPAAAESLVEAQNTSLFVVSFYPGIHGLKKLIGNQMIYYVIPQRKNLKKRARWAKPYWEQIVKEVQPDIVHVHGTEYSHGLSYVDVFGSDKVVVSIQGMPSVIERYCLAGLSVRDILKSYTLRDFIKGGLLYYRKMAKLAGVLEIELLSRVEYVIGRTSWDRAHTWAINPNAKYFCCNETLREPFYSGCWSYAKCKKHSIFLSQASRPLKGMHMFIKALPLVLRVFPDTTIRVAGDDFVNVSSFRGRIKMTGYAKLVRNLITKYDLSDKISFTGPLSAEEMKQEYLSANVFVCPSSIENSPNSLCEAQILGTPCVASFVGGTPDFYPKNGNESLYRYDDECMLARKICDLFMRKGNIDSSFIIEEARKRHDKIQNNSVVLDIYNHIIDLRKRKVSL